ncbi:MAG: hypothetical protein ACTSPI_16695 [Candidatus Heimdallarchaeaceae archaeon]
MKIRIKYRRARVTVTVPDNFKRECCIEDCPNKHGKIDFHHYRYAYKTSEIRKNPQLALKNTILLCFHHHRIADAMRTIENNYDIVHEIDKKIEDMDIKPIEGDDEDELDKDNRIPDTEMF